MLPLGEEVSAFLAVAAACVGIVLLQESQNQTLLLLLAPTTPLDDHGQTIHPKVQLQKNRQQPRSEEQQYPDIVSHE